MHSNKSIVKTSAFFSYLFFFAKTLVLSWFLLGFLLGCSKYESIGQIGSEGSFAGSPQQASFQSFQAVISKNCNSCHGDVNSPFPGIANFTIFTTEDEWLNASQPYIVPGDLFTSTIYQRLRFAGDGGQNNMPFSAANVKDNMTSIEAKIIENYILSLAARDGGPKIIAAQSASSALAKVKLVAHGGAMTGSEMNSVISGDQIDVDALKTLIGDWISTNEGQEKLKSFLNLSLQTDESPADPNSDLFGTIPPRNSFAAQWHSNLQESFTRTALDIINRDAPFTEILTTRRHAVTSALLASMSYADNVRGGSSAPFGNLRADDMIETVYGNPSDYSDWRFVNITQATNSSAGTSWRDANAIRSVPDGGNFALYLPRVGFFNTLSFQMRWQTNEQNDFRVLTSQTLIVALNATFEAGDQTPHSDLSGLDPSHSPANSACYQCHRLMDPMKEIFKFNYHWSNRSADILSAAGPPKGPSFNFQGMQRSISSIDDFAQALSEHPKFATGWTQKLCSFVNSAPCEETNPEFQRVAQVFKASNHSFKTLMTELLASELVIGDIVATGGAVPRVSINRRDHFCQSLLARIGQYSQARNTGAGLDGLCSQQSVVRRAAVQALPGDGVSRGKVDFVQSKVINAFSFKAMEVLCREAATAVVNGNSFSSGNQGQIGQSIEDLVVFVMGLPTVHARNAASRQAVKAMYDYAVSLGLSAQDSMREAFVFACSSPEVAGMGL